jgi:uncharacterized membrane protein (UPF0127 family)
MKIWEIIRLNVLFLFLLSCTSSREDLQRLTLTDGEEKLTFWVEIADEPEEHQQGLMGRMELPEDQGMLFIFPKAQLLSFWMKNTLMPLDLLFFDARGRFVGHQYMVPCEFDPCLLYRSRHPAKYALEVHAGIVAREGIGDDWSLSLSGR